MKATFERIHQDLNFKVSAINGQKIEEIFGIVTNDDEDDFPVIVNLKLKSLNWQRFFLDAYIGFWEISNKYIDELDSDTRIVDYGKKYNIIGLSVNAAKCINGEIILELSDSSKISLVLNNPTMDDTDSKLIYESKNA